MADIRDTDNTDELDPTKRPLQDNLGMGPVRVAAPGGAPSLTPPISRPISATGVPMYNTGESVPATGTAPPVNPHIQRAQQMEQEGSGVSQVQAKHPFWGGVLRGLDVAASVAAPRIAPIIPGTTAHHNALIQQQEGLANQDIAQQEKQAQTADINAQTQQRLHPEPKEEEQGKTVTTDEGIFQWNPQTHSYDTKVGDAPGGRGQVVQTDQGPILLPPGKTEGSPITVGGQPAKAPAKPGNDFEQYYKDYLTDNNLPDSSHNRLLARKEYAQAGHITVNAGNEGTWSLQEDHDGKPVLFNNKTGAIKPAPEGLASKGEAKQIATDQALGQSASHALNNMKALAKANDPASNYAYLMNFIGMSYEGVRGARLNRAEIERAAATRSLPDQLQHMYDLYVEKQQLTPQQKADMLGAAERIQSTYQQAPAGNTGTGVKITRDANGRIIGVE